MTFAAVLRRAMEARGMSQNELARRAGLTARGIRQLIQAHNLPLITTAQRLADALQWEGLVAAAVRDQTRHCVMCDAAFVAQGKRRLYCSTQCSQTALRRRGRSKALTYDRLTKNRLTQLQEAVAAHCAGCEPDGLCRQADCALRDVSPLPFVPLSPSSQRTLGRVEPTKVA